MNRYIQIIKQMIKTRLGSRSWLDDASYFGDAMATKGKAAAFLQSEKFWRAYNRGENSGHNLCGGRHLHIEWRVHIAICMAIHAKNLPGDFVECGVNTGIISLAICDYLDFNKIDKKFYLFDTFCGIPEEQMSRDEINMGRPTENARFYSECYELAVQNFSPFSNAILVKGKVPDTLESVDVPCVSYLHLDMNIAEPELQAINFFWDRLSIGSPILMDDYGWKGYAPQRKALGEFAISKGCEVCELPTGQGLLIKS